MRRYCRNCIAALLSLSLLAGSAACVRTGPVFAQETATARPIASSQTVPPDAMIGEDAPARGEAPLPTDTPIPASVFMETYFRHAGDPPEVRVYDEEHGHWEYRADTLDVRIDCITTDTAHGVVTYFVVNIHVRDGECPYDVKVAGVGSPWQLARESRAVLLLSGSLADFAAPKNALVENGEAVEGLSRLPGRGVDARAALGEISEGHYLAVVADGRQPGYSVGLTRAELADILVAHGAWSASGLGSGRQTALVFMGEQMNRHAGVYAGDDPSYQARIGAGIAFGRSEAVPKPTDPVKHDGNR